MTFGPKLTAYLITTFCSGFAMAMSIISGNILLIATTIVASLFGIISTFKGAMK